MYSKNSKGGPPMTPAKSKRKQRGDKQEQAGGAQCTEAPVSCRGLGLSDFVVEGSQAGEKSQAGSLQALDFSVPIKVPSIAPAQHGKEHKPEISSNMRKRSSPFKEESCSAQTLCTE